MHRIFILCFAVLSLAACQTAAPYASDKEKSITVSTEQISSISTPLLTPARCENFVSNIDLAEQKTVHQTIPMTMINGL